MSSPREESSASLTTLIEQSFALASSSLPSTSSVDPLVAAIRKANAQAASLALYSSNDTIDDLPTSSLRAVLLDALYAQALSRLQTKPGDFSARSDVLTQSLTAYRRYLSTIVSLGILDSSSSNAYEILLAQQCRKVLSQDISPLPSDAVKRRASKIAALQLERGLKKVLEEYSSEVRAKAKSSTVVRAPVIGWRSTSSNDASTSSAGGATSPDNLEVEYDVLILPRAQQTNDDEDGEADERDDSFVGGERIDEMGVRRPTTLRAYLVALCHLHAVMSLGAIDSIFSELDLLASLPSDAESLSRERANQERIESGRRADRGEGDEWRLDQKWGSSNSAPLLDSKGKPQRPFTILPSGSAAANGQSSMGIAAIQNQMDNRQRLREQVFQPSHRLPTMSIDEYLAEEQRRGNVITGGGQASAEAPTSSEQLAWRAEGQGVGTREAEMAAEEQRRKAEEWDIFTENNPKGMGNTMNRG